MKDEKGITLMSLIIYIIVLMLVTAMLIKVSDTFFFNLKNISDSEKYTAEFNKFNMYFIEDIKNNKSTYKLENDEIIFENGIIYTYKMEEQAIYRNKVKVCSNVTNCEFLKAENELDKNIIKAIIQIKSERYENEYVLKYW